MSAGAGAGALLLHFALGYLAINAVPGPNMLAVGALAALRGVRGVLPFCLGIATGAGTLALVLHLAFSTADAWAETTRMGIPLEQAGRALGGVLLLLLALQAMTAAAPRIAGNGGDTPGGRSPLSPRTAVMAFAAGVLTAATNPLTAAYLAAQFLGPLAGERAAYLAVLVVPVQALAWGLVVATLFSRPAIRRIALSHHRLASVTSGLGLATMAIGMLLPLFR